jgi:hypothetical protein
MENREFRNKTFAEFTRLLQHFPIKADDQVSVILKGHLLVEELLVAHVNRKLRKPEEIRSFKFYHFLCLAKAFESDVNNQWVWAAVEKLNSIRNKLAHNLEPKGFESLLKEFIELVESNDPVKPDESLIRDFGRLKIAIMSLHRVLSFVLHFNFEHLKIPSLLTLSEQNDA